MINFSRTEKTSCLVQLVFLVILVICVMSILSGCMCATPADGAGTVYGQCY